MLRKFFRSVDVDWEQFFIWTLIISGILQVFIIIDLYTRKEADLKIFQYSDDTNNFKNVCALPVYDFWDEEVTEFIKTDYDPFSNCNKLFVPLTELKNGHWSVKSEDPKVKCRARCHRRYTDFKNLVDPWVYIPGPVDCEVLETVCSRRGEDFYGYLHTQIIPEISSKTPKSEKPDVFVILLDSMSFGEAKRSLLKTLPLFTSHFQAVEFPFINKVGENSRPNSVALWFGKMMTEIKNGLVGGQVEKEDWSIDYFCYNFKDNESNIFSDFRKFGYKTLLAEDWKAGALNYPNCRGFDIPPVDHYMRTFQIAYESDGEEITKKHLDGTNCREVHHPMIEYSEQFMSKYKDDPKFSWIWAIEAGHGDPNGYMRVDKVWLEYFERNMEVLDNAFVFLMSDHGFRVGHPKFLESTIGAFEMNNPYLAISVPKKYRNSTKLIEVMTENAGRLQTHFDTRAALLDILEHQPKSNFTSTEFFQISNERGQSLLRHQPDTPRTCGTLPIPVEYCICQMKTVDVDSGRMELRRYLGQKLADQVNLRLGNYSKECVEMELSKTISIQKYEDKKKSEPYDTYIVAVAMKYPSFARFKSILRVWKSNNQIDFGEITRTNRYVNTGDCVEDGVLRTMCFCKNSSYYVLYRYYDVLLGEAVAYYFGIG